MGVVRVNGDALGQLVPRKMRGAERAQHALQPGADEEIFLLETQLLPGHGDFSTLGEELANNFYIRSALRGGNADF